MSDDRLFASNNAIGRKWYYLNIVILGLISYFSYLLFNEYIIPNTISDTYSLIATWGSYFLYLILIVTFFALIERRVYDICGQRDSARYKNMSSFFSCIVIYQLLVIVVQWFPASQQLPMDALQNVATLLDFVFVIGAFFVGTIKGQISNMSYDEYRKRDRYR